MKLVSRAILKITVCDYCQYRKCRWTKHEAGNLPEKCEKETSIEIADDYLREDEFNRRVKIAKRLASYHPNEKVWYLDPTVDNPLTGYELKETVEEEVNEWSEENELELSDLVEYEISGFERLG